MNRLIETERVSKGPRRGTRNVAEREHCGDRIWWPTAHAVGKPARLERSPLLEKFDPGGARHATDSADKIIVLQAARCEKAYVGRYTTGTNPIGFISAS